MNSPQSLSAERREEIDQLWDHFEGGTDLTDQYDRPTVFMALEDFWNFIAALDAQHAERWEAAILQIQAEAAATEDGETLESLTRVIERLRAISIEGTGQ